MLHRKTPPFQNTQPTFAIFAAMPDEQYEPVIGLEVHAQLLTKSKLFCGDGVQFGDEPNVHVSAISLAHPGTLPLLNKVAEEKAIQLGLALNCDITEVNFFARKNYFYPDLPKGYQISQDATPICRGGEVSISSNGKRRTVKLNRIHLEEDAGKSLHDMSETHTFIDLNRAGTPLLEIVTEPDIFSPEEAFSFLTEIRRIVRHLDVCDGNMEQGSLRCDANVSLRKKGEKKLGTRVEIKNLNSIRNVKKALEFEINRLTKILISGNEVQQETRSFEASNGTTFSLRSKEDADDYRYFPDPELAPLVIDQETINQIRKSLPALPHQLDQRLEEEFGLSEESIKVIGDDKDWFDYFLQVTDYSKHFTSVANWMIGPVKSYLNREGKEINQFPIEPKILGELVNLVESGKVNFSTASTKLFAQLLESENRHPAELAKELNLIKEENDEQLEKWIEEVLHLHPEKVASFKKGKKNLISLFAGEVRKRSKGTADMQKVNEMLIKKLQ